MNSQSLSDINVPVMSLEKYSVIVKFTHIMEIYSIICVKITIFEPDY